MNDTASLLLRSLQTAAALTGRSEFPAAEVNRLAATLKLSDAAVIQAVEHLKAGAFLDLKWGGTIALAAKALGPSEPPAGQAPAITLGPGAIYAPSAGAGAAIAAGGTAAAHGAIVAGPGAIVLSNVAADLAALLQALRALPPPETATPASAAVAELAESAEEVLDEIQHPHPDQPGRQHNILERFRHAAMHFGEHVAHVAAAHQVVERAPDLWEHAKRIAEALTHLPGW